MARATKTTTGTEVVDWEKEMAAQAELAAAAQRSTGGGGKFFSMKSGQLSFDNVPLPGNMMAVIVMADTMENSFYDSAYDPDTPTSPKCFAFARDEKELAPHEAVDNDPYFVRQHDTCNGCPQNEWGSARTGRGKACANVMRLAMIPAGTYTKGAGRAAGLELTMIDDEEHYEKADPGFMKLSVLNVKGYANYVRGLAAEMKRPPHGVFTNVSVEPDAKSQFKVIFEVIGAVPNNLMATVMKRHKLIEDAIGFPYTPPQEKEEPKKPANTKLTRGRR
jgi:hypothetical protein